MGLISQCGSHITLDDIIGFDLNSVSKLSIIGGVITFDAPITNLKSPMGEINIMKVDTLFPTVYRSIVMCNQFDLIAKNGKRVTGTFVAYFKPFDDAPVEKGFEWGKLFLNVAAGLAVVAFAAAVIFTVGAALGVAAPTVATVKAVAIIGGCVAIGITALGDIKSVKVSSLSTYVTETITGIVSGAVTGALGPSIFGKEGNYNRASLCRTIYDCRCSR